MNLAHNEFLRAKIKERIKEVFGNNTGLIKDASSRGMDIQLTRLSKYLNGKTGSMTDDHILWVATRLGIFIHLNFGTPVIDKKGLKYEVLPYDEKLCLKKLEKIFK